MKTQPKIYVAGHRGMVGSDTYDVHTQPMQSHINVGFGEDITIYKLCLYWQENSHREPSDWSLTGLVGIKMS